MNATVSYGPKWENKNIKATNNLIQTLFNNKSPLLLKIIENNKEKNLLMSPAISSNILSFGGIYENTDNLSVFLAFKGGELYRFYNVKTTDYFSMLNSESIGSTFNKLIKTQYKYKKIIFE